MHSMYMETHHLQNILLLSCPCQCHFSIEVNQFRHPGGSNVQGEADFDTENGRRCVSYSHISHDSRSKPYPSEHRFVRIPSDQVSCGTRVEGPGLLSRSASSHFFEIVGIDHGMKRRLFAVKHDLRALRGGRLGPILVNGCIVKNSFKHVLGKIVTNYRWGMNLGISLGRISSCVLEDD